MVKVILNEQHTLLEEQKTLLDDKFGKQWVIFSVPAEGWNRSEIGEVAKRLVNDTVVFASPIPLLLGTLAYEQGCGSAKLQTFLLHNDKREKKELPTGKVISVVAKTGWELIPIE